MILTEAGLSIVLAGVRGLGTVERVGLVEPVSAVVRSIRRRVGLMLIGHVPFPLFSQLRSALFSGDFPPKIEKDS
jgi:hypothetical protein